MSQRRRIAIVGGGPIGVEAAARAVRDGFDVTVYEAGEVGEHLRRWAHVTLFSPWEINRSPWGIKRLKGRGVELASPDQYPSGREYLERYLLPLSESLSEDVEFHLRTRVLGVSRDQVLKGDHIGDSERARAPFLLRVDGPDGERYEEADIVIDASGVLSQPNPLGPGGLAAIGEEKLNGELTRKIPDVDSSEGEEFGGRRILVVGHGHSALTTLDALHALRKEAPRTQILWAYRAGPEPCASLDDDPLPERARLDRFGNAASRGDIDGIEPHPYSMVRRLHPTKSGVDVTLQSIDGTETVDVDRVVANVGYRPDTSIYRELQVHLCYATGGPMKLAANLLSADGGGDCLAQMSGGVETLRNPEPNFFILGAKSYGRNPNFLLRLGFEQIDDVFRDLETEPSRLR